ncbi:hypothetical protein [Vibrio owensii]|uniref:hypothetical protein n=1 Tax=Vibrio owensii TaxID=696485 RepID=UPI00148CCC75|nr:hypothetical protein [Vibrio owensii]NOI70302.1 hypothetical protein [Vibrio owensii]
MKFENSEAFIKSILVGDDKSVFITFSAVFFAIIAVYVQARFKKAGEYHELSANFKDLLKQQKVLTSETEIIKRTVEKVTIEFEVRFSKFHEREIEAIDLIYKELANVYVVSKEGVLKTDEDYFEKFYGCVSAFRKTFESHKIWIDQDISKNIEDFVIAVDNQIRRYHGTVNTSRILNVEMREYQDKAFEKQEQFYDFVLKQSGQIKCQIESKIRDYLVPIEKA